MRRGGKSEQKEEEKKEAMLYSGALLTGCSCCSAVQSTVGVTGVGKKPPPCVAEMVFYRKHGAGVFSEPAGRCAFPESPSLSPLSFHLSALLGSAERLPAAKCGSHRRWEMTPFLFFIFIFFWKLKEAAAVDVFMGHIYSEGSGTLGGTWVKTALQSGRWRQGINTPSRHDAVLLKLNTQCIV